MGIDEQREEREVLDSIFPDEITDISDTAYRISIVLDVTNSNMDPPPEPPTLLLTVTYPDTYPDVAPYLDITSPPNAPKDPYLDIQTDKPQLLDALQPTIEDSMGMAMVFTLVSTLKEVAETLIADRQRQQQEIVEVEKAKKEEEENRKFHGTAVTRERFLEWRDKFRAEMDEKAKIEQEEQEAEDKKKKGTKATEVQKMSGRMLWEKGLVGKVDEDIDGEDALAEGLDKLKVQA